MYYRYNDTDTLLYEAPSEVTSGSSSLDEEDFDDFEKDISVINEPQEIIDTKELPKKNARSVSTAPNYSMINFKISETQKPKEQWCAAYVVGGILNNKNSKISTNASTIMKWKHGNLSYTTLKDKSISQDDLIKYGNTKKVYPKKVSRKLSIAEVRNQLNKGNAVYAGAYGSGSYQGKRHAFAIYGWINYEKGVDAYYVWNPWWNYPCVIDASKGTLPVNGGSFTWDSTITNW